MTVYELIQLLEEQDPDAQVRVAYQENYPLVGTLDNVVSDAAVQGGLELEISQDDDGTWWVTDGEGWAEQADSLRAAEAIAEEARGAKAEDARPWTWLAVGSSPYDENPYGPAGAWSASDD